jgi:hypothetical protein
MAESDQQRERLLDLVVYAPVGLALTVLEDLPKLAEKGRARVEGQLSTARVLGQFAVQMAKQQLAPRRGPAAPTGTPRPAGEDQPVHEAARTETARTEAPTASRAEPAESASSAETVGAPEEGLAGPSPREEELAIPNYESLSASQVVPRLAGLSPDQLEQVRRYELAHRHRRTVLNRIEQLSTRRADEP